jgi:short-subunit dehydrogenase
MTSPPSRHRLGTAVVTGASAGIGKIYADRLAKRGHDLLLVARRENRLSDVAAALRSAHGVNVSTLVADLGNSEDLERVAKAISADASITMLVNNAGTATMASVVATTPEQMLSMVNVNVTALARLTQAVLPRFKSQDSGTIVNVGSVLGLTTVPGVSNIYSGTKGFVMHFTRALQSELTDTRVRVQLVLPAATATEIWEHGGLPLSQIDPNRVMKPEQLVDAALAGLDMNEAVTMPSVSDANAPLLQEFDTARLALFASTQFGVPAQRYSVAA